MKTHFFERSTNTVRLRSPISNHDLLEENSAHLIPICTTNTTIVKMRKRKQKYKIYKTKKYNKKITK